MIFSITLTLVVALMIERAPKVAPHATQLPSSVPCLTAGSFDRAQSKTELAI